MILANGCSFTEGYDLESTDLAWPSQLGKIKNIPVHNIALGGASNDRISRTLKEALVTIRPEIVVVGWTTIDRNELHHRDGFYVRATSQNCLVECEEIPNDVDLLHQNWLKYNHNSWINYRDWIYSVLFFQQFFEELKIPYLFFTALGNNYINEFINQTDKSLALADKSYQWRDRKKYQPERTIHKEWKELVNLCQQVNQDRWVLRNQCTMQNYVKNYGVDSTGHPTAPAHLAWAEVIADHLK